MRKVKWSLKYLLLIPIFSIALVIANFIPFLLPVVAAGKPITMEQAFHAFVHSSSVPIFANRARLGMVFTGHPEIHKVYRARREALLERVASSHPERQVIAVISLNNFYSLEQMPNIIDPAKFNIIGASATTPRGEIGSGDFGTGSYLGVASGAFPRYLLPDGHSWERSIENWNEFHKHAKEGLEEARKTVYRQHEALRMLKAGEIPTEELQNFHVIIHNPDGSIFSSMDVIKDPAILAMTSKNRLQREEWDHLIDIAESSIERSEFMVKDWEEIIQTSKVYGVVVRGPAAKINELRLRPEISIVDPALFPGIFGTISEGRKDLVLEFQPTLPDAYLDDSHLYD